MSIACQYKQIHGPQFCISDCPVNSPCGVFAYHRIEQKQDMPAPDPRIIDIAILDMNHGWPNLGHDSLVHLIQDAACDIIEELQSAGLMLRALSFDVRRAAMIPEHPNGRFSVYVGTGGPGHIDPKENNGQSRGSQGIVENARWEAPLFHLFDAIRAHDQAALLAVCHTFGVLCRWSGTATAQFRGSEKGGKSSGILENLLTPEAKDHPWFGSFSRKLPDGWRFRILDNRLFDLIPSRTSYDGPTVIGYETIRPGGPRGEALTMVEWAREKRGTMPRIFGVNHHPEIVDRKRQLMILQMKMDRGEASESWYAERLEILSRKESDQDSDNQIALTSNYTIVGPLRYYILREVRYRAERLHQKTTLHEDRLIESYLSNTGDVP